MHFLSKESISVSLYANNLETMVLIFENKKLLKIKQYFSPKQYLILNIVNFLLIFRSNFNINLNRRLNGKF